MRLGSRWGYQIGDEGDGGTTQLKKSMKRERDGEREMERERERTDKSEIGAEDDARHEPEDRCCHCPTTTTFAGGAGALRRRPCVDVLLSKSLEVSFVLLFSFLCH